MTFNRLFYISLTSILLLYACDNKETTALEQKEAQLDARIEQLEKDLTHMERTLKTKEEELQFIEQKLDSVTKALLKKK